MLVITGFPRSGTSLMAEFVRRLGIEIHGDWLDKSGLNAGMEDTDVVRTNNAIREGRPVHDLEFTIRREAVKDPRMFEPDVLSEWLKRRDDLRFLVLTRDPKDVRDSLSSHKEHFPPREDAVAWLEDTRKRSMGMLKDRPHRVLVFPDYLRQPEAVIRAVAEMTEVEIRTRAARMIWMELVDFHKVRHSRFTQDVFRASRRSWEVHLRHLWGQPLHVLEIGVMEGRGGRWMLDNVLTHEDSCYTGIDWWKGHSDWEKRARKNLKDVRATLIKGDSGMILPTLTQQFDVISVDGDHTQKGVLRDSILAWDHLKPGGVMMWDDYEHPEYPGVKLAIEAFLPTVKCRVLFIGHNQYGVQKL